MSSTRSICSYDDCVRVSHRKTGPCQHHYLKERGALPKRGGARPRTNVIDYDDFWSFVKKNVIWDGEGRPLGVKARAEGPWKINKETENE